jgi:hypothetical protein
MEEAIACNILFYFIYYLFSLHVCANGVFLRSWPARFVTRTDARARDRIPAEGDGRYPDAPARNRVIVMKEEP